MTLVDRMICVLPSLGESWTAQASFSKMKSKPNCKESRSTRARIQQFLHKINVAVAWFSATFPHDAGLHGMRPIAMPSQDDSEVWMLAGYAALVQCCDDPVQQCPDEAV